MYARFKLALLALLVTGVVVGGGLATASAGSSTGRPRYLAAGDSNGVGRRASDPETTAYVPLLAAHVAPLILPGHANPQALGVANTSRLGDETTADMINDGQLAEDEAILLHHNQNPSAQDDVDLVTFTIGGNDMRALLQDPRCAPVPGPNCAAAVGQALAAVQANLQVIMSRLRAAAGPDTVIATMTYYNPFVGPACTVPGPLGALIPQVLAALNNVIVGTAAPFGILVAPVANAGIGPADLFGDCIHVNDSGYAKIAQAFASVVDPALD